MCMDELLVPSLIWMEEVSTNKSELHNKYIKGLVTTTINEIV